MTARASTRPLPLLLLVLLVAGALLGVSCHLAWADHGHEPFSCAVCAWFHFKGWISAALVLLVAGLAQGRRIPASPAGGFSLFPGLHPARAPPHG